MRSGTERGPEMEENQSVSQPINWAFVIIATVKGGYCSHTHLKWRDTHFAFTANWQLLFILFPRRELRSPEKNRRNERTKETRMERHSELHL